jgi:hypothetical protein
MMDTVSFAFDQAGLHACLDAMSADDLDTLDFGLIRLAHCQTT